MNYPSAADSGLHAGTPWRLMRRGHMLGEIDARHIASARSDVSLWQRGEAVYLPALCAPGLAAAAGDIVQAKLLYLAVLDEESCEAVLAEPPYRARLEQQFESLGGSINEGDEQEIETVFFDAVDAGEIKAEDLWLKVSWLSFHEEDASLRFRFSFGVDHVEDVAADPARQRYAAALTDAIFPESRLITQNAELNTLICGLLGGESPSYVERIVYFNAAGGGAYFHHDRERGHAGVVYAQLSGQTFWLALPKQTLLAEIIAYVGDCEERDDWPFTINDKVRRELKALRQNEQDLSAELDSFCNDSLIQLINETGAFIERLIRHGYGKIVHTGDVLLLSQKDELSCCWHSVFCLGDEAGEALSFAVRANHR